MTETEICTMTAENFSGTMNLVESHLEKAGFKQREIYRSQLIIEETFHRQKEGTGSGEDFSMEISLRREWGGTELRLVSGGSEYNPIPDVTEKLKNEKDIESVDAIRFAILKSHRSGVRYVRKNNLNLVLIRMEKKDPAKRQLAFTVMGMALGVLCGILMRQILDESTLVFINSEIITPTRNVFLNAIHMMMAPVTFFAIIAGITELSNTALIGKLGGRMIVVSMFMQFITILISLGAGGFLFLKDLSYMQAGIAVSEQTQEVLQYDSLKSMLFDIVPQNLVDPFQGDRILQVIFLAIFFGLVLNSMGDKSKGVNECINFVFRFFLTVLRVIVKTLPLVVFLSMTTLFSRTGIDSLVPFGSLFLGLIIGVVVVWAVGAVTVLLFAGVSPVPMTAKIIALSPLVFTVSSSHARLPFVLKFCQEKLGIDSKLAAFSIPVGVQLNKAGISVYFALVTLMMMSVYGIAMTPELFVTLVFSVCLMSIAKPPVPCGGMICLTFLFVVAGVPPEAISVVLCVEPIAAMFNGVCNESTNITTTFILAANNDMFDKDTYYSGAP